MSLKNYTTEEFIDYCKQSYRNYIIDRNIKIKATELEEDINRLEELIRSDYSPYVQNASEGLNGK